MAGIRDLVAQYLTQKRIQPPGTAPFDVNVSNSTATARGAVPGAAPQFAMAPGANFQPSPDEATLGGPTPPDWSLAASGPAMPAEAPPPPPAVAPSPRPIAASGAPAAPAFKDPGAPLPEDPADIVRAASASPAPAADAPAAPAAPAADPATSKTGLSIIGKALAAFGDAGLAGDGQKGNFLETIGKEDAAKKTESRLKESDAREKIKFGQENEKFGQEQTKFAREEASLKNQNDPNSAESRFAQEYIAKLTSRKPEEFADMPYSRAKELLPTVEKAWSAQEAADARRATLNATVGTKQDQFDEKQWVNLEKRVNLLQSSSRSALGSAAIGNQRADRALQVLDNPQATDQDLQNAMVDLAGIFQGGSPHESSLGHQQYKTLQTKINNIMTYITSSPTAAKQPAVRAKLRQVVQEIKDVDNKIIGDNMKVLEAAYPHLIQKDPQRWANVKLAVTGTTNPTEGISGAGQSTNVPQAGDVVDGYRFKGGNTKDEKNWEPI